MRTLFLPLCILLFASPGFAEPPGYQTQNNLHAQQVEQTRQVTMYATSWCPVCAQARDHFRKNGIAYREFDVETHPVARQQWKSLGGRGVPLIVVGDQLMNGFSASRFEYLYRN